MMHVVSILLLNSAYNLNRLDDVVRDSTKKRQDLWQGVHHVLEVELLTVAAILRKEEKTTSKKENYLFLSFTLSTMLCSCAEHC